MVEKLRQGNHKLRSSEEALEGIAAAKSDDPVTIDRTKKELRFSDGHGRLLGTLTARHEVVKLLDAGETLLHCCVAWTYPASERYPFGLASARVAIGDPDDTYNQWMAREVWGKPREPQPARAYAINVVGGGNYQDAIKNCRDGDAISLFREVGNPHDPRAIVAKTLGGEVIGYVPRTSWLETVVHGEGCGATALIKQMQLAPSIGVTIEVVVTGKALDDTPHVPPR